MADLPPLPQPTGVFTSFIAQQTEVIVVDEKGLSLSGDSFNITLANGTPLLKVQGKVFSFRQRKAVSDVAGNHLCTIRSKASSLIRQTYWVEDPSEKFIMEVKFSASKFIGSRATVTFSSNSGKAETMTLEADWRSKRGEIKDNDTGATVARITRESTVKHYLGGAQTYTVTVAPNMDMALVMAMCVALDEKTEAGKGAGA